MKRFLNMLIISLIFTGSLFAQENWLVPEDQDAKRADFQFDETSVESGAAVYLLNCKSCHGMPGEGNYVALNPIPGDPATEKIQQNSDGAIFYKIREGRGLMPSFKKVLSVKETWDVIAYLRGFNPEYVQEVAVAATNNRWTNITIDISLLTSENKIKTMVSGLEGDSITPVAGAEVILEAQRRFGLLQIGDVVMTNKDGVAYFDTPKDLPGDPDGYLNLVVQLENEEEFGIVKVDTSLQAGMAFTPVSLTAKRAMWNTMRKAPVWLLLTYLAGVLTVWGFIFFVMLQLRTIFKLGEAEENRNS
jgi:mono/diheme cytochrome c family protein